MPIPQGITIDDVYDAARRLDAGASHSFGAARKYLAVVNGKQYPPKALIGFWTGTGIDTDALAAAIGSTIEPGTTSPSQEALESEEEQAAPEYWAEGRNRLVIHFRIERNRKVVADAKAKGFNQDPKMPCSVGGMSLRETYGEIGEGYIEAHHTESIATLELPKVPTMDDLVPVCANCHRVLHRKDAPVLEVLRKRLQDAQ